MTMKNTSIRLATVVLVLAGGLPITAAADKVVEMDLRIAGSFVASGILHLDVTTTMDPVDTTTSVLIHAQAKGKPGRAEIRGFGGRGDTAAMISGPCLGASSDVGFLRIDAMEDPLVFNFLKDLSLLFADGSGQICLDLMTGNSVFRFDIFFTGGRGRFEGATGNAVIEGESTPVSSDGSFVAETGTIVGWIIVPDDNDDSDSDSDSDD